MPSPAARPVQRPQGLPPRTGREVADRLGVTVPDGAAAIRVTGVSSDSHAVCRGDLYAALPGRTTHGARFTDAAAAAGAVAVLTDPDGAAAGTAGLPAYVVDDPRGVLGPLAAWVYGDPSQHLRLIGVTGTNGKTTTAYLLEAGLRAGGRRTGLVGTIETRIGDDPVPSVRTTPEAADLQAVLAVMRERGVEAVAMEVSSHALALGRVDGTAFDVVVFTNLTADHLDFHADLDDYFAAKARLFDAGRARVGVVDVDDPYGARLVERSGVPVVTVSPSGRTAGADWRARAVKVTPAGSAFRLEARDGRRVEGGTALAGAFNVDNAVLALVALVEAGVDPEHAAKGVAGCAGVPGRMERVAAGQEFLALVDYAHSPDALERLLATARQLVRRGGRLVLVVGAGGDRDPHKRPAMGDIAARGADVVVLTDDNPRSEDPAAILAGLKEGAAGVPDGAVVEVVPDRRSAIEKAVGLAGPGDVVVVAGKGHEQGQEVAGVVHPFDDRTVLREAIAAVR